MKLTISGSRYRLRLIEAHNRLLLEGPGLLVGVYLPEGVALNSPDLRRHVEEAIARDRDRKQAASESIRNRLKTPPPGR